MIGAVKDFIKRRWPALHLRTIDFFRQGTANVSMAQISACIDVLASISRGLKAARTK